MKMKMRVECGSGPEGRGASRPAGGIRLGVKSRHRNVRGSLVQHREVKVKVSAGSGGNGAGRRRCTVAGKREGVVR